MIDFCLHRIEKILGAPPIQIQDVKLSSQHWKLIAMAPWNHDWFVRRNKIRPEMFQLAKPRSCLATKAPLEVLQVKGEFELGIAFHTAFHVARQAVCAAFDPGACYFFLSFGVSFRQVGRGGRIHKAPRFRIRP